MNSQWILWLCRVEEVHSRYWYICTYHIVIIIIAIIFISLFECQSLQGTELSILHVHLILSNLIWDKCFYYSHLSDDETEPWRSSDQIHRHCLTFISQYSGAHIGWPPAPADHGQRVPTGSGNTCSHHLLVSLQPLGVEQAGMCAQKQGETDSLLNCRAGW